MGAQTTDCGAVVLSCSLFVARMAHHDHDHDHAHNHNVEAKDNFDPFDSILNLESNLIDEGYEEGVADGDRSVTSILPFLLFLFGYIDGSYKILIPSERVVIGFLSSARFQSPRFLVRFSFSISQQFSEFNCLNLSIRSS